jgi:hypothetical protein
LKEDDSEDEKQMVNLKVPQKRKDDNNSSMTGLSENQ